MLYNIIANVPSISDVELGKIRALKNVIALDGAANILLKAGIIPKAVVGDFDSLSKNILKKLEELGVVISKIDDQNTTDLEKGIMFCDSLKATEINIYNAFGERIDHSLFNLRILKSYHSQHRVLKLFNNSEYAQYIKDTNITIFGPKGSSVSIMAFPEALINSDGLKYEMSNYSLKFAHAESVSNSLSRKKADIMIKKSALLILSKEISFDKKLF